MLSRTVFVLLTSLITAGLSMSVTFLLGRRSHCSRPALVVGCVHLVAVLINAWMIEVDMGRSHGEALLGWILFDLADLPSSLLQLLISVPLQSFLVREVLLPILFYGVVGSFQYLVFAELFTRLLSRLRR